VLKKQTDRKRPVHTQNKPSRLLDDLRLEWRMDVIRI